MVSKYPSNGLQISHKRCPSTHQEVSKYPPRTPYRTPSQPLQEPFRTSQTTLKSPKDPQDHLKDPIEDSSRTPWRSFPGPLLPPVPTWSHLLKGFRDDFQKKTCVGRELSQPRGEGSAQIKIFKLGHVRRGRGG